MKHLNGQLHVEVGRQLGHHRLARLNHGIREHRQESGMHRPELAQPDEAEFIGSDEPCARTKKLPALVTALTRAGKAMDYSFA